MVAELLRLKSRMILNGIRLAPARVVGRAVLLLIAVVGLIVVFTLASRVGSFDGAIVGRVVAVGGTDVALAALLLPVMFSRIQLLEPRAFLGYPIRSPALAAAILLLTLVGPAILLIPLVLVPVRAWRDFPATHGFALIAAPLLLLQLLLLLRVGSALGSALNRYPALRSWARVIGAVSLLGGLATLVAIALPRIVLLAPDRSLAPLAPLAHLLAGFRVERIADALAGSPLAALWGAPALAVSGTGKPVLAIWIGVASIAVLALIWLIQVAVALSPTHPLHLTRSARAPAWFRALPTTPAGAVAGRSFIYWVRDPRYRIVFGVLPFIPVLTIAAFRIGGVPLSVAALVPLPLMVLVLAWSTIHNDIAYDSTAVWSHLVAQTRGVHDRLGRIWPVLVFGTVLIAVGTPITVWAQGDPSSLPAVLGINIALLLGGLGVGSGVSARSPYPAPRPGDGAFTFPQASSGSGGGVQGGSFFLTVLVAAPPVAATVLWMLGFSGRWPLIALGTGIGAGLIALLVGILVGGRSFDRRGPELLAFTMQN